MKKKVLMLASVASMIDQFNIPNIKLLLSMGYSVDVACNFFEGSTCDEDRIETLIKTLDEMGVGHYHIDFSRSVTNFKGNIISLRKVKKLMTDNAYEFVHCHSPIVGVIARIAGKATNTKVIYTAHGFHFYKSAPIKNWLMYFPIEWLCSYYTETLITINHEDYEFAKKHMHAKKVEYIPGVGIDLDLYDSRNTDCDSLRGKLGIEVDDIVLIYVAELNKNKNQALLIKMMSLLCKKRDDIKLLLVGKGHCEEQYREKARVLGLQDKVIFTGYRSDVIDLYQIADIAVASSIREGLGLNIIEAMASGVPVVACVNRGHCSIIENEKNGFLIEQGDYPMMVEKIMGLINDSTEYLLISQEARKRAECFSIEIVNNIMQEIYRMNCN